MANEALNEKVSVNINSSTLSSIDLLVDNGYYSNRSDFINQALREALSRQQPTLERIIAQNTPNGAQSASWFVGLYGITRKGLLESFEAGERYPIRGYGVLIIDNDCPEDVLFQVVESIRVKGKVVALQAIKAHYGIK